MKTLIKAIPYLLLAVLMATFGLLIGRYVIPDNGEPEVNITSQTILQKISTQGFLVTHTVVSEQKIINEVDQGSDWSNFWWGHEIEARATLQTTYGIDLSELIVEDIFLNATDKLICIKYPTPSINSTSLVGDIEVEQTSGVLKKLLDTDNNKDYNLALSLLTEKAEDSVSQVVGIDENSYIQADKTFSIIAAEFDYQMSGFCRE